MTGSSAQRTDEHAEHDHDIPVSPSVRMVRRTGIATSLGAPGTTGGIGRPRSREGPWVRQARVLNTRVRHAARGGLQSVAARRVIDTRTVLGVLLAFGALHAFAGGYYGLSGAEGVPTEWLAGSPFVDYFIPSLLLFFVVGGTLLTATVAVFARWHSARLLGLGAGTIIVGWLAVQVAIIGYVSWMQPTTAIFSFIVLVLAWLLPTPSPEHPA